MGSWGLWGLLLCAADPDPGNPFGAPGRQAAKVRVDTSPVPRVAGKWGLPGRSPGPRVQEQVHGDAGDYGTWGPPERQA